MDDKITFSDGAILSIIRDDNPESPRDWENLGTMVCFHNRYNLGDKHDYKTADFDGWDALKKQIETDNDVVMILPVRAYAHSGIALSIGNGYPFNDVWDSGMVGFIFATTESIRECFGVDVVIDDELRAKVTSILEGEVETYNQYLAGDIWGFNLQIPKTICETCKTVTEWEEESCWGFYGSDPLENGMTDHFDDKYVKELKSK